MEIDEAKEVKKQLEDKHTDLLRQFTEQTGLAVERVEWVENNGSFEARINGKYFCLVSQSPNDLRVLNPGK